MTNTDEGWETPPGAKRPGRRPGVRTFEAEARLMRAKPGEWLRVRDYHWEQEGTARNVGSQIRSGRYPALQPAGSFEAVTRTVLEDRQQKVAIYARYVGEHGELGGDAEDAP